MTIRIRQVSESEYYIYESGCESLIASPSSDTESVIDIRKEIVKRVWISQNPK